MGHSGMVRGVIELKVWTTVCLFLQFVKLNVFWFRIVSDWGSRGVGQWR